MPITKENIHQITRDVWSSMLGSEIQINPEIPASNSAERCIAGSVNITGSWNGTVLLFCSAAMAGQVAGLMLGSDPAALSPGDISDTVGELTNIIGGNIKALVPPPAQLSLPSVITGVEIQVSVPNSRVLETCSFEFNGNWLLIRLLEKVDGAPGWKK